MPDHSTSSVAATFQLEAQPAGWFAVRPTPAPAMLKAFYADQYYQEAHGTYEPEYSDEELNHRRLGADLLIHAVESVRDGALAPLQSLLDVGCGEGWLLKAAAQRGCRVRGLDFSAFGLRRHHPELEAEVRVGDVFETLDSVLEDGETADVCALEHVLEHVVDPEQLLNRLKSALAPGGVLVITVPNDFSPLQKKALSLGVTDREFWVRPPEHLNYFNAETLPRFLESVGYVVLGGYASFPIDWFLLHPGANYVRDPETGKQAHQARLKLDLLLAENGVAAYHSFASALYGCGAGRSITVLARVGA